MTLQNRYKIAPFLISALFFSGNGFADAAPRTNDLSAEEKAWLEDDSSAEARQVSEGELRWVTPDKTHNQYRLENTLTLNAESLKTGWITFSQCHYQLDPRIAIDIVYGVSRTQNLTVTSSQHIGSIEIAQDHISLKNIEQNAQICVTGKTKVLTQLGPTQFRMVRGPYIRKFLDGFYPMQVTETIRWNGLALTLNDLKTQADLGYDFKVSQHQLIANYWFEGLLKPFYEFTLHPKEAN